MEAQQWAALFNQAFSHEPSPQEFATAKAQGFSLASLGEVPPAALPRVWALAYEGRYGRKPSIQEFSATKDSGFDLAALEGEPDNAVSADAISDTAALDAAASEGLSPESTASAESPWQDDGIATELISVVQPETPDYPAYQTHQDESGNAQPPVALGTAIPAQQAQARVTRPLPKHFKLWVWLGVILSGLLWAAGSAGYYFLNYFGASPTGFSFYWAHQPSELNRYINDYNTHKPLSNDTLHWYVWSDTSKPVAAADLKYKPALPASLSASSFAPHNGLLPGTHMQRTGTQYLFFPKYQVAVTPQKMKLQTDAQGLTLSVAGSNVGTADSNSYAQSLNRMFPGSYDVAAKGTINQVGVNLRQNVKATTGSTQADFNLQFITFHLYSNVLDGDVYVGDSKIGTLNGGDYKFNQIPVLANQQLRVQRAFTDGIVKTKSTPVSDIADGTSIYLNWGQELTQNAAGRLFSNAQSILSNTVDGRASDDAASVFEGGTNNPVYTRFMQDGVTDVKSPVAGGFKPSSITLSNATVNKIVQTGVNTYDVTWSLDWDFDYSDVSNADDTQTASGDYTQTCLYVSQVKYIPGSNVSSENNATNGLNGQNTQSDGSSSFDGSDSSGAYATGNDSTNFLIASFNADFTITNTKNDVTMDSTN
ncbi:TcaA 3rd/4th domain-containing protein [Bifidobacterium tibiigranuli]|jgi:hypothetical protein|uniref:TcaA 3rd/4th domain-containing protein n=1 Tax=Bifidobacterium tibiigranuli TaxID=2172043 RepID=UPI0026EBFC78|nr:hypothetical protein [Bifidobacterium tibiigranuli]MCI1650320.1 hypothetical protein [Bifidobacterium tibiigranuli]MCI2185649.1 hypothetical protein [Bifidobacterium tibiigranuli]MCI2202959.1 hypothetical protein [Bifidobacterium tibiigranuli]